MFCFVVYIIKYKYFLDNKTKQKSYYIQLIITVNFVTIINRERKKSYYI